MSRLQLLPRSESGLSPPKRTPNGPFKKDCIIIHHTASGRGIMTPGEERSLMRSWQNQHEAAPYYAWDILQGYSYFQSGRVYENRNFTSSCGAIYDTYNWSKRGVGIECDGTYSGSKLMTPDNYAGLVEFCSIIYQRPDFHAKEGRWIYGHCELPPCRSGDAHPTSCPGNLLRQFVLNQKLQNDVLAYMAGEEEEEENMAVIGPGVETTKYGQEFFIGTPPGRDKAENVYAKARNLRAETAHVTVKAITNDKIEDAMLDLEQNKGGEVDIASLGVTGSTLVEVVSDVPVYISFDQR